ncbi:leucine-rich repeat extensin-like protein 5 [Brassica napus]|uniref:leucine-rich repeat extensin-like protein 5 n=1 Tax=Brassica napus TaxID=3708 RepID=UPI00207A0A02|nr:leucine-rich repeat extensin-like protein 5 [Brassica napus]
MASSKENPWFSEKRCDSGSNLGEPPAHRPPDPLDPPDYAPLVDFPPLPTSPATITSKTASSERKKMISTTSGQGQQLQAPLDLKQIISVTNQPTISDSANSKSRSEENTIPQTVTPPSDFSVLPPKHSSPLQTNSASSKPPVTIQSSSASTSSTPPLPIPTTKSIGQNTTLNPQNSNTNPSDSNTNPPRNPTIQPPTISKKTNQPTKGQSTSMFYVSQWGSSTHLPYRRLSRYLFGRTSLEFHLIFAPRKILNILGSLPTHCHRIGHIPKDCIYSPPAPTDPKTTDESNAKVVVPDPPDTDECLEDSMELYNPGNEPPAVTDMEIELIHTSPPVGSTPDRPDNDLIETSDEIPQEVESLISDPLIPIQSIPISSPIPPINTQKPSHSSPPPPQPHKTSLFHPPLPKPTLFLDSLQPMPPLLDPI